MKKTFLMAGALLLGASFYTPNATAQITTEITQQNEEFKTKFNSAFVKFKTETEGKQTLSSDEFESSTRDMKILMRDGGALAKRQISAENPEYSEVAKEKNERRYQILDKITKMGREESISKDEVNKVFEEYLQTL